MGPAREFNSRAVMGSTPIRSIMVVVYHVCGASKLSHYIQAGYIKPPVRAWVDVNEAARFSKQTGRPIILRLKFPSDAKVLEGHKGLARYIEDRYPVDKIFGLITACYRSTNGSATSL